MGETRLAFASYWGVLQSTSHGKACHSTQRFQEVEGENAAATDADLSLHSLFRVDNKVVLVTGRGYIIFEKSCRDLVSRALLVIAYL